MGEWEKRKFNTEDIIGLSEYVQGKINLSLLSFTVNDFSESVFIANEDKTEAEIIAALEGNDYSFVVFEEGTYDFNEPVELNYNKTILGFGDMLKIILLNKQSDSLFKIYADNILFENLSITTSVDCTSLIYNYSTDNSDITVKDVDLSAYGLSANAFYSPVDYGGTFENVKSYGKIEALSFSGIIRDVDTQGILFANRFYGEAYDCSCTDRGYGGVGGLYGYIYNCTGGEYSFNYSSTSSKTAVIKNCNINYSIRKYQGAIVDSEIIISDATTGAVELKGDYNYSELPINTVISSQSITLSGNYVTYFPVGNFILYYGDSTHTTITACEFDDTEGVTVISTASPKSFQAGEYIRPKPCPTISGSRIINYTGQAIKAYTGYSNVACKIFGNYVNNEIDTELTNMIDPNNNIINSEI